MPLKIRKRNFIALKNAKRDRMSCTKGCLTSRKLLSTSSTSSPTPKRCGQRRAWALNSLRKSSKRESGYFRWPWTQTMTIPWCSGNWRKRSDQPGRQTRSPTLASPSTLGQSGKFATSERAPNAALARLMTRSQPLFWQTSSSFSARAFRQIPTLTIGNRT